MTATNMLMAAICLWSGVYGVPIDIAHEVCLLESSYEVSAVGDDGLAQGPWQIHPESWKIITREMVEAGELCEQPPISARRDPWTSTKVAMWAMGNNYAHWWTTYPIALENVEKK